MRGGDQAGGDLRRRRGAWTRAAAARRRRRRRAARRRAARRPRTRRSTSPLRTRRAEHDDALGAEPARDEDERLARRVVEPVDVVGDDQQRPLLGRGGQQRQHPGRDREAVEGRRRLQRQRAAERARLHLGDPVAQGQQRRQQLQQAGERDVGLRLVAARPEDPEAQRLRRVRGPVAAARTCRSRARRGGGGRRSCLPWRRFSSCSMCAISRSRPNSTARNHAMATRSAAGFLRHPRATWRGPRTTLLGYMTAFADLGLSEPTLQALQDVGYEQPSPIQEQAIPILLQGEDIIGQAQTGSGKTAAFGLPIVEHVDPSVGEVQALVLTPTRELCIQVTQALRTYGARKGVDVVAVFGGARSAASSPAARRRPRRRRHRRPRARPAQPRVAAPLTTAASSSSTRPTRCSTSASSRTSRRSSSSPPTAARPRCSARRCRRRSASSPTATSTTR